MLAPYRIQCMLLCGALAAAVGCRSTKPGTHVELVDKGGEKVYVAGAAGPGVSKTVACQTAVSRSVRAIALRFAQEHEDEAEDIAEAVGASDGAVFMQRFAKDSAFNGAVQDVQFDPANHLCMATVRWTPPVFVKDAVAKYAQSLKEKELAGKTSATEPNKESSSAAEPPREALPPTSTSPASPAPETAGDPPPPPPVAVAPQAPPQATAPACRSQRSKLGRVMMSGKGAVKDFNECMRRTDNDETICHRYKLYVEEAAEKEEAAAAGLAECINASLGANIRVALGRELAGHSAVAIETKVDGTVVLWTFSPADSTSYAVEITATGELAAKTPLAANQVQWVRSKLAL